MTEESPLLTEDDYSPQSSSTTTTRKITNDKIFFKKPHALWMLPFSFILFTIISSTIAPLGIIIFFY